MPTYQLSNCTINGGRLGAVPPSSAALKAAIAKSAQAAKTRAVAAKVAAEVFSQPADFGAIVRSRMKRTGCRKGEAIRWAVKHCPQAHAAFEALPADQQFKLLA